MSIQKKSLISTLKTTKKANVASTPVSDSKVKGDKLSSMRSNPLAMRSTKQSMRSTKHSMRNLKGIK